MKQLNMKEQEVEGKASCWLLACLCGVHGALLRPLQPTERDRLLDFHMRKELFGIMQRYAISQLDAIDKRQAEDLRLMMEMLHKMPSQGKRRQQATADNIGWKPAAGWGGTFAFHFLSRCVPHWDSNSGLYRTLPNLSYSTSAPLLLLLCALLPAALSAS